MSGFSYDFSAGSGDDRLRHYFSLPGAARQSNAGWFAAPDTTGNFSVTGLPFQPECLILFGTRQTGSQFEPPGVLHLGAATGPSARWAVGVAAPELTGLGPYSMIHRDDRIISCVLPGSTEMEADLVSFDANGFTLDFTDAPAVACAVAFLALRGEGSYAVGTELTRTTDGTQATTGLGFQPDALLTAYAILSALATRDDTYGHLGIGGADADSQHNVWTGGKSGDAFNDNRPRDGEIISMYLDSDVSGPFEPTLFTEAALDSLDADGFTLDFTTTDGTARYFSWIAFSGGVEEGRWTYNHSSAGGPVPIATVAEPKGLIFFSGDRGDDTYPQGHNTPGTHSFTIGFGVCDEDLNQLAAGAAANDQPNFNQIRSVAETRDLAVPDALAFGAYEARIAGDGMPNNMRDCGTIVRLSLGGWIPQIYRRVIQR